VLRRSHPQKRELAAIFALRDVAIGGDDDREIADPLKAAAFAMQYVTLAKHILITNSRERISIVDRHGFSPQHRRRSHLCTLSCKYRCKRQGLLTIVSIGQSWLAALDCQLWQSQAKLERLTREYDLDLITTAPSVVYQIDLTHEQGHIELHNPADMPDPNRIATIAEP